MIDDNLGDDKIFVIQGPFERGVLGKVVQKLGIQWRGLPDRLKRTTKGSTALLLAGLCTLVDPVANFLGPLNFLTTLGVLLMETGKVHTLLISQLTRNLNFEKKVE